MGYIGAGVTRFNTADELTVTGDAQIDTTTLVVDSTNDLVGVRVASPDAPLQIGTGARGASSATFRPTVLIGDRPNADGNANLEFSPNLTTGNAVYMSVDTSKNLKFGRVDSGTFTETVRIDSSGNVGIGTTTIEDFGGGHVTLEVAGSTTSQGGVFKTATSDSAGSGSAGTEMIIFTDSTNGGSVNVVSADPLRLMTANTEAARIDASGNLLVGTTSQTPGGTANTPGVALSSGTYGGLISATRDGGAVCDFNRKTSDGGIVQFRKDGTTVGSIGNRSTALQVQSNGGVGVDLALNNIFPLKSGSLTDDAVTLGDGTRRFKDLYLSGGAYIGGTAAANQLDDYEEGTWTPDLNFAGANTGITYTLRKGRYVKIGRTVIAAFHIELSSKGSATGFATVNGVPFQQFEGEQYAGFQLIFESAASGVNLTGNYAMPWNNNSLYLRYQDANQFASLTDTNFTNTTTCFATVIYET